ncbi:MAG: hypothetical protein EA417_09035 [Gammaproteobacteria bacterium]|nr:MAG: hypothetical protein EA417_09035 [Gammaproteobacteria bacterium]
MPVPERVLRFRFGGTWAGYVGPAGDQSGLMKHPLHQSVEMLRRMTRRGSAPIPPATRPP